MALEVGTTIFNERGEEREVALDRRDKGGKLWAVAAWGDGDNREQLKRGTWLAKNEENAAVHMLVQSTETSIEPLLDAERSLRRRIAALRSFSRLVTSVVANGTARVTLISDVEIGSDNSVYRFEENLAKELGEPIHDEEERWVTYYKATVTGLPNAPVVTVIGTNGVPKDLTPPEDFGEIYCG